MIDGWADPNLVRDLVRDGGAPAIVMLGLIAMFKMWLNRGPGETRPWVIRLEHSLSEDTLVRLAALVKRYTSGKRPAPPAEEPSDEPSPEPAPRVGKVWR